MAFDWFTLGAQTLNFLILVWLMKRFLYRPILDAIDAREQRIAAELADADAQKIEAQREREAFRQKNAAFEAQRAARESEMLNAVHEERQRLLDEARHDADTLTAKRKENLQNDAKHLTQALRRRTREEVFGIARKTLHDLASSSLEAEMVNVFTQQLRQLNEVTKAKLLATFQHDSNQSSANSPVLIRSAFELPQAQRQQIQQTLKDTFGIEVSVRFETLPEVINGIELISAGEKVEWSIGGYLRAMEQGVAELLQSNGSEASEQSP